MEPDMSGWSRSRWVFAALALSVAGPAAAQTNPIVGSWNVSYVAGTRMENGAATNITATGKLIVQVQGDSLIARLIPDPIEGTARPESRMAAQAGAGKVVFVQRGVARVNINGEQKDVTSISTWTLSANGDALEGTLERRLEGMDTPSRGPLPVTGTRVRS
jgi:hypothetical protein